MVDLDRNIFVHSSIPCLYRGWIITPEQYFKIAVHEGVITSDLDYNTSYNFLEWYNQIQPIPDQKYPFPRTPDSYCLQGTKQFTDDNISLSEGFFSWASSKKSLIVKDWIKSRKHEWFDACFIPDTNDRENLFRVVRNFIEGQGEDLVGGLVFREYIPLKAIGTHPKSKMPLTNEHRFFVFKGQIFYSAPYWDAGFYGTVRWPEKKVIVDVVSRIKSSFFAIDVAETTDGEWIIVEINDGGTAGIPDGGSVKEFYKSLRELF